MLHKKINVKKMKKSKYIGLVTTLIFFLRISITLYSQISGNNYIISFEKAVKRPCFGALITLDVANDFSFLKNIPDIVCDISAINSFKLNQYVKTDSIPNQMYIFIGVNESKKEKYVVVDANNNHDFSDDVIHTFALPDEPLTQEEKAQRAITLQITPDPQKIDTVKIGIDPFNYYSFNYGLQQDRRLELIIVFPEYMYAKTYIEDTPVEIYVDPSSNLFQRDLDEKASFTIWYNDKANNKVSKYFNIRKDTFQINDNLYKLSKIEHPNIHFKKINILSDSSSVGSFVPVIYAKDINNNSTIFINERLKDKYIFIDFWGSWCGPCIQSIPKLKFFYEKIKNRDDVLMLGLSSESDEKGVEKMNEIIRNNKIEWSNLWFNSKEQIITTSIMNKLNISAFPTYLILDNKGKIVYKKNNVEKTQEAIDFFMDLIN